MNETKFTPGPWFVNGCDIQHNDPNTGKALTSDAADIAFVNFEKECWAEAPNADSWRQIHVANANLIASAPELYAALESLIEEWQDNSGEPSAMRHLIYEAMAVLAKARGEA